MSKGFEPLPIDEKAKIGDILIDTANFMPFTLQKDAITAHIIGSSPRDRQIEYEMLLSVKDLALCAQLVSTASKNDLTSFKRKLNITSCSMNVPAMFQDIIRSFGNIHTQSGKIFVTNDFYMSCKLAVSGVNKALKADPQLKAFLLTEFSDVGEANFDNLISAIQQVEDSTTFLFPKKEVQDHCYKEELFNIMKTQLTQELSQVSVLGNATMFDGSKMAFCGKFIDAQSFRGQINQLIADNPPNDAVGNPLTPEEAVAFYALRLLKVEQDYFVFHKDEIPIECIIGIVMVALQCTSTEVIRTYFNGLTIVQQNDFNFGTAMIVKHSKLHVLNDVSVKEVKRLFMRTCAYIRDHWDYKFSQHFRMEPFVPTQSGTFSQLVGYDRSHVIADDKIRRYVTPEQYRDIGNKLEAYESPFEMTPYSYAIGVLGNFRGRHTTHGFELKHSIAFKKKNKYPFTFL